MHYPLMICVSWQKTLHTVHIAYEMQYIFVTKMNVDSVYIFFENTDE